MIIKECFGMYCLMGRLQCGLYDFDDIIYQGKEKKDANN